VLFLDSVLAMTRGNPLKPFNFLSYLNPSYGHHIGVFATEKGQTLMAQIRYPMGAHSAHLTFLVPGETCNLIALPGLLEHLAYKAGGWGALNLIGEVDEHTLVFEAFRRAGFSIYAWQRIWLFNDIPPRKSVSRGGNGSKKSALCWSYPSSIDSIAIHSLYQSVVPALVMPIELVTDNHLQGLVCRQNGDITAYADLTYGPRGIWVQPFILPETENVLDVLSDLLVNLPHRFGRPVYLCVRSYQAWLESALEDISAQIGPRQAVMVKHMAVTQKSLAILSQAVLDKGAAEATVQVAHVEPVIQLKK
jgi:hypothetical protein